MVRKSASARWGFGFVRFSAPFRTANKEGEERKGLRGQGRWGFEVGDSVFGALRALRAV